VSEFYAVELATFIIAITLSGSAFYLVFCSVYFALTSRSQLAALKICWKLGLVSIIGIPLAGFGGAILATLILHGELHKSPNYRQIRDILASIAIAVSCSIAIYFALMALAFGILD